MSDRSKWSGGVIGTAVRPSVVGIAVRSPPAVDKITCPSAQRYIAKATRSAHADLEHNCVFGKLVGVIDPADLAITVQG